MKHIRLALSLCVLFVAVNGNAQDARMGIPAFASLDQTSFDSVNRQNLNTHISIPIVSLPGRGFPFQLSLNYDSLLWTKTGSSWTPVIDEKGLPTWGWGKLQASGHTKYRRSTITCIDPDTGRRIRTSHFSDYVYVDPTGGVHSFPVEWDGCNYTEPSTGYSTDGLGYYISVSGATTFTIVNPSGVVATVSQLTDSNGNSVAAQTSGGIKTWTDTRGNAAVKIDDTVIGTTIFKVIDQGGGNANTYTLSYAQFNVKTNFGCGGVAEYTSGSAIWLPASLTLPNGQSYGFAYEDTPGYSGYKTGRLSSVALPTGATFSYSYPGANGGIDCSDGSYTALTRSIAADGTASTWSFARMPNGGNSITTVTYPQMPYDSAANDEVFTFAGTQEVQRSTYQGSSGSGSLVQTVATGWSDVYPSDQTVTLANGQHKTTHTDWSLAGPGNIYEYDWSAGAGNGSLLRTTSISYITDSSYVSNNLINLVSSKRVYEGGLGGTLRSSTDYIYDGPNAVTSCPTGMPQHDDTNFGCTSTRPRGLVTTIKQYADVSGNPSNSPVTTTFTYDSFGNVRAVTVDGTLQSTSAYSAATKYSAPDSVTLGSSTTLATSYTYNPYTGLMRSQTDANNGTTQYSYDAMFRPLVTTRPDNKAISYSYNDGVRTVTVTNPFDTRALTKITWADQLGRTYKTQSPTGTTQTVFDPLGRTYQVSNPFANGSGASYWTTTRYDALGRTLSVTAPDGAASTYSYSGNTVTAADGAGNQRMLVYDAPGRLTSVYEPDVANNNALTVQTLYAYNALDSLLTVLQGAQTRSFVYDGLNRVTSAQTPEAGTVTYSYAGCSQDATNVCSRTDARGVVTTYSYDSLNRPYQISYNVGSTGVPATRTVTYAYGSSAASYNNGRLLSVADGTHSESYSYDLLGNVKSVSQALSGQSYTTQYDYNDAGLVTKLTYPSGMYLNQGYDAAGRLSSLADNNGKQYASGLSYNAAGQVTGYTMGLSGGTVNAALGYSAQRLQLQALSYGTSSNTLLSLSYGYAQNGGNNGQITAINDLMDNGRSATYGYDALRRLTSFSTAGSANYPSQSMSWTYDRYGNRLTQGQNGSVQTVYPWASTNRLNSSYDNNGNLLNDGTYALTWDAENRLVSYAAGSVTHEYDGNGLRVRRTGPGGDVVYVFGGTQPLAEYAAGAAATNPAREHVYLGGQLLAKKESGAYTFYERDHLSVRGILSDANPNSPSEQGHLPFGENWYGGGNKWKFTSYERDSDLNDDFAVFRRYQYGFGRFSSPDPVFGSVDNPQSWNRYAYALNDPLSFTDPTGLRVWSRGDCWYETIAFYVDNNFQGYDTRLMGCFPTPGRSVLVDVGNSASGGNGSSAGNTAQQPANNPVKKPCRTGFGAGLTVGADAVAGLLYGAGGNVGAGAGVFAGGNGVDAGVFASGAAGASASGHAASVPRANLVGRVFAGLVAGAGGGVFLTNASQASQLSGLSGTWNVDLGAIVNGSAQFSAGKDSAGNNIWSFSFTIGAGLGAGYHNITNKTAAAGVRGGC